MSSNQSFQLPDLLGIIGPLELRTNRHCRFATDTSETWLTSMSTSHSTSQEISGILSKHELSYLRSTKIGLLCALCFPTCDAPQLRVLTDFVTLLFYSLLRENIGSNIPYGSGLWAITQGQPSTEDASELDIGTLCETPASGVEILKDHELLRHILDQRVIKSISAASQSWNTRFKKSVLDFQAAQRRLSLNRSENIVPSLEEYTAILREMYGGSMVLDLSELMEVFQFPDLQGMHAERIINLKHAALDVIAWSTDVVSYQLNKTQGNSHNIVAVLMHHKNLSVQGAMNLCGNMIKQAFSSFCSAERSVLDSFDRQNSLKSPVLSWVWTALTSDNPPPSPEEAEAISDNTKRYIRTLKDCIVGIVHWVYETELFFGKKGGEIRTFGWVFVDQVPVIPD